ncbi:Multidrug resistance efflux pump membrane-fusion protein [Magnetospirillum sp. LM-5]|uniref:HlyD family type I secretion periplasmic adaptor subunit n=1 Tax=Magnetospirillum sp. LM-5 TaxID=2681466 RepID=UPI00137FE686|nr:HlyD family type I secretion periplasmic adaptor subunit [Magnetospirillum sp. LM-5]CAA7612017.1 Multidrug resistance efflux pump membrane-fusion protein [Magnetospirillum sp. LM-5]
MTEAPPLPPAAPQPPPDMAGLALGQLGLPDPAPAPRPTGPAAWANLVMARLRGLLVASDPAAPPPPLALALARIGAFLRWIGPQSAIPRKHEPANPQGGRLWTLGQSYPLPTWTTLSRFVMGATALSVVWAMFARLDEVSVAQGDVVPEGKVKVIQHLEGGVVREILVSDGAEVKEGTPLMQLELSASSMNREELQVRLDGLVLQRARLQAELAGKDIIDFPAAEAARQPTLVESEKRIFDSRRQALKATLSVMQDQVRGKHGEVQELDARQRAVLSNLRLVRERLAMSTELIKSGLTSRMDHVALQGQVEEQEGVLETLRASIPRAQAALAEAKGRIEEEQAKFIRQAQGELGEAELNLARTRELLSQASDQQRRTLLTSPIDGIVKNLRANTIGGVVRAGDPIMEIVPLHERLQIDVRLNPMDRGYVQVGQPAMVKLTAYDYTTYGGLEGKVIMVAPDTTVGQDNQAFYRVVVQTEKAYLGDEGSKRSITAGMQATVDIHTGTRTVMEYLIKPVLKLRHEAFRER